MWTKTWYDPGIERDVAEELLDEGADVIAMHQDSPAPLQAAERRGKHAIGYNSGMEQFAPGAYLAAPVWNWGTIYKKIAEDVHNGDWKPGQTWWGIDKDVVRLDVADKIPANLKALVGKKQDEIGGGNFDVFSGPIKDQHGNLKVSDGKSMSDKELLEMNFFVEGVQGLIQE